MAQKKAVMAVLQHEQDHTKATLEEHKVYHQDCGEWCQFKVWEKEGKPLAEFNRRAKDKKGKDVEWKGGLLANFKNEHGDAYTELYEIFESLCCKELMERCPKVMTQNINESFHRKLWKMC